MALRMKYIAVQFMTLFDLKNAMHSTQSGQTALIQTINKFQEAINNGQTVGMVMVDIRKAFDLTCIYMYFFPYHFSYFVSGLFP